nr:DUF2779 domain-containing protein [Bacteroidota bacterium]
VINCAGYKIKEVFLVYINSEYLFKNIIEPEKLFKIARVTGNVTHLSLHPVKQELSSLSDVLAKKKSPTPTIGRHCFYPEKCPYLDACEKNKPKKNSALDIPGLSEKDKLRLIMNDEEDVQDITKTKFRLDELEIIKAIQKKKPRIDLPKVRKYLNEVKFPLFFVNIESFSSAVPFIDDTTPYQHLPFHFSVLKISAEGTQTNLKYTAPSAYGDFMKSFLVELIKGTEETGTIVFKNETFQIKMLEKLSTQFPDYSEEIDNIIKRSIYLMRLFRDRNLFFPDLKGSHTFLNVLKYFFPDFNTERLHDQVEVGFSFINMEDLRIQEQGGKLKEIERGSLQYALAMYKVFETMEFLVKESKRSKTPEKAKELAM